MIRVKISDIDTLPEDIAKSLYIMYTTSDMWGEEDKQDKLIRSVRSLITAAENLNVGTPPDIDSDGRAVFPSRIVDSRTTQYSHGGTRVSSIQDPTHTRR